MSTKEKIVNFIKSEVVLCVATIIAIITCFFVPIDREYLAKCDEQIESIIDKTIISWEDFLAIPNLYKANY